MVGESSCSFHQHRKQSHNRCSWASRERVASKDLRDRMVFMIFQAEVPNEKNQQWSIPNFQTDPRMYIYIIIV